MGQHTMRRVDTQVNGHWGDALVLPCETVRLRFDLLPHLIKVCELLSFAVEKFSIFWEKGEKMREGE